MIELEARVQRLEDSLESANETIALQRDALSSVILAVRNYANSQITAAQNSNGLEAILEQDYHITN